MLERLDGYVKAIWTKTGLWGFVVIGVLLLAAAYLFGVDLGAWANRLLGVQ